MEDKVIRDGKGLLEYINKTSKGKVFNTYKTFDYDGIHRFEKYYREETAKRCEDSGFDMDIGCYNTLHLFEGFEQ